MNTSVAQFPVRQEPNISIESDETSLDALGARLVANGLVSETEFKRVRQASSSNDDKSVVGLLVSLGLVAERSLSEALADMFKLPILAEDDLVEPCEPDHEFSLRFLREHTVLPVAHDDEPVIVVADPFDVYARDSLQLCFSAKTRTAIATPGLIERSIEQLYGEGRSALSQIVDGSAEDVDNGDLDIDQLMDMASEAPVIRLVNHLVQNASNAGASDVHVEPYEDQLKVRYRIDGVLHDVESPPRKLAAAVISRIKIMARLDIAERRLPQDGRVKLKIQGKDIDARVSTVPTMHGESVVMRLLNRKDVALDLESLGYVENVRESFLQSLRQPNGLILVTGPTGSGKTTTLYTALDFLNTEQRKIITAEDPVEYQIEGINQIQVKPAIGLTFDSVLRSIVRQDPDVILVGEMRDAETARICVQSALTGHLVLSTLHTNSAASSVTRLLEMGIEDYLVTSTVITVISQRLVRRLCDHCKQAYVPSQPMITELRLDDVAGDDSPTLYRPVGCEHCNGTGYRGRLAIVELLPMTDTLRRLITGKGSASDIEQQALTDGMRNIYADGCMKALSGLTSVEEVLRVIQEGQ